jgi:hypothetical protein
MHQMATTFATAFTAFCDDLIPTFPELAKEITALQARPVADVEKEFVALWKTTPTALTTRDPSRLFTQEFLPGIRLTAALWGEVSEMTHKAIWNHLQTLALLSAASFDVGSLDLSGMMHQMKEMAESPMMKSMMDKLKEMMDSFGKSDASGAAPAFKIPERLFKGQIAKMAEELAREFKPEDFGLSPELLETSDPTKIFGYLQEIFTKKPELLMAGAQRIAKKIQAKFERGELKREDLMREAEEMMKEFSDNPMFSELFGGLTEMLNGSDRETGNDGSARRRAVQERLRKKMEAKKAAATAATAATATSNSASASVSSTLSVSDAELEAMFAIPSSKKGADGKPVVPKKK